MTQADWQSHHIEGYAVAAMERGSSGHFSAPLISHIIGNLWVGGCINGVRLGDEFKHVVSLYPWEKYKIGTATDRVEYRVYDAHTDDFGDFEQIATDAARLVNDGQTLIHCQAGLNRSNLVASLVLIGQGMTAAAAIALLREKRSPMCLCNKDFEDYLLDLDPEREAV